MLYGICVVISFRWFIRENHTGFFNIYLVNYSTWPCPSLSPLTMCHMLFQIYNGWANSNWESLRQRPSGMYGCKYYTDTRHSLTSKTCWIVTQLGVSWLVMDWLQPFSLPPLCLFKISFYISSLNCMNIFLWNWVLFSNQVHYFSLYLFFRYFSGLLTKQVND